MKIISIINQKGGVGKKQITWLNNNGKHIWFNPNNSIDDIKRVL